MLQNCYIKILIPVNYLIITGILTYHTICFLYNDTLKKSIKNPEQVNVRDFGMLRTI